MHSFQIADGQVTYSSRFLRSDSYKQNSEMNRIVMSEFGTLAVPDPCKNIFQRFMSSFKRMSKCTIVSWLKMQKCSDVVIYCYTIPGKRSRFCYIVTFHSQCFIKPLRKSLILCCAGLIF